MSDRDEPGPDDLERRLDAAFAATRPRRGFEDELWARLRARRPWWRRLGDPARRVPLAGVATGVAALLVVGLVVTLVRAGGSHGPQSASTAATRSSAEAPLGAPPAPGAAAQAGFAFGQLPAPAAAGALQAVLPAGPLALTGGSQRVDVQAAAPPVAKGILVYRFDPASGPPAGTVLDPGQVPAGLAMGTYPARSAAEAVAVAAGAGSSQAVVLTQVRLVYVAVVADGAGYLEPAYLYTGTAGGAPVQLLLSALTPSALR
jgi:hypothetical protein